MSFACLMAFVLIGQEPAKDLPLDRQWQRAVEIKAEPIKLGEQGTEIVTIRMKIKPKFFVYATPQVQEELKSLEMRLTLKSKNPMTRIAVQYPKGTVVLIRNESWIKYEGEVAVIATVHRAKGDESPLECTLRFVPGDDYLCFHPARINFTLTK